MSGKWGVVQRLGPLPMERIGEGTRGGRGTPADGNGESGMIEAVIWDFGGVLTTSPFEAFVRFERSRGLPEDLIRRINATNPLENAWARLERGEIDRDTSMRLSRRRPVSWGMNCVVPTSCRCWWASCGRRWWKRCGACTPGCSPAALPTTSHERPTAEE